MKLQQESGAKNIHASWTALLRPICDMRQKLRLPDWYVVLEKQNSSYFELFRSARNTRTGAVFRLKDKLVAR